MNRLPVAAKSKHSRPAVIGIPRTVYYHLYPSLWEAFFGALDIKTLVSGPTTQHTISQAELLSESDHCLILKLLDAHFAQLARLVDTVFVPRIYSGLRGHIACPKLSAIPDTASAGVLSGKTLCILDVDESRVPIDKALFRLARHFGFNASRSREAAETALSAMQKALRERSCSPERRDGAPSFVLIGHPYLLYDAFFSGPIVRKMKMLGVHLQFPLFRTSGVVESHIKWDTSNELYDYLGTLTPAICAGVIQISSFNCGCDSLINEYLRHRLEQAGIPYMGLVLDGHSSRGWMETRIEAFVESIGWEHAAISDPHDG